MAQLIAWGIVLGGIITLGAVGLTLIYGVVRFANFAHGDLMTLGAYIALLLTGTVFPRLGFEGETIGPLSFGWLMLASFIPAMLIAGGVAAVVDRIVYRRMRNMQVSPVMFAMSSLAIAFVVRGIIYVIWGADFHFYSQGVRSTVDLPLDVTVRADQIVILFMSLGLVALVYAFLQQTKMGKALRAMADNPDLARVSGIPTERMIVLTWVIGGGLAAAAGIMLGIDAQVRPEMGWIFLLPLFAAVIMGGIGNTYGALAGGMVLGIAQQVSTRWLLPSYKPAVAFGLMILILLVRPQGIMGSTGE